MLARRLRTILKKGMPSTASILLLLLRGRLQKLSWRVRAVDRSTALQQEINFWKRWFVTGGLSWPSDFRERMDPNRPIQHHVATYIDRLQGNHVRILDVGAGPLTKLGKGHRSKQLVITATDLLANEYDRMLDELSIDPPIRTIYADAENLVEQFGVGAYDIVHGQNCIDHTANPLRAIEQMLAVTKPLGFVVLCHAENEGQREHYRQLHQWDFTCSDGCFLIRDRSGRETNVTTEMAEMAEIECTRVPDGRDFAIVVAIHKRA